VSRYHISYRIFSFRHHVTAGAGLICGPEVTSANYTDVFPHDRIVYLSPDAQEDLDAVEGTVGTLT
jgi:hypothetical protein